MIIYWFILSSASVSGSCWSSEVKTPTQTWSRWSIGGSDGVPQTQTLTPLSLEPAESLKSVKTFRRPADGRKMKRDHPNCWTAQLNTIVKTFFPVCVCVNSTDDRVWHWSSTLSSVTQSPDGAGPSSRCRVSSAAPPSLLAQLTMWFIKNLLYKKTEFFSPVRKRETQVFLCSKVQRTERSAASWEVSCFNCSVFIQCIKKEAWGRSGILEEVLKYDKDWQILMEVNSGLVVSDR